MTPDDRLDQDAGEEAPGDLPLDLRDRGSEGEPGEVGMEMPGEGLPELRCHPHQHQVQYSRYVCET